MPSTPISNPKRRMGSKIMLKMAPESRTALEYRGLPSARITWAMAVAKMPKGTPKRRTKV